MEYETSPKKLKKGRKRKNASRDASRMMRARYGKVDIDGCFVPNPNLPVASFSSSGVSYFNYTKEETPIIGKYMKRAANKELSVTERERSLDVVKEKFEYLYSSVLPGASRNRVKKDDFSLDTSLLKDKPEGSCH